MTAPIRPRVWIGSSSEGLKIVDAIEVLLEYECEVEPWKAGTFEPGGLTLQSLVSAVNNFDFAILVLTADDSVFVRNQTRQVARDNVIFELGLFMGALGPERTFMVHDRTRKLDLPSDLAGFTAVTFEPHSTGNDVAALGAAANRIKWAIQRLGVRESREASGLSAAAGAVEDSAARMERLLTLLLRSRKVELKITEKTFGQVMGTAALDELQKDLAAVMAELGEQSSGG